MPGSQTPQLSRIELQGKRQFAMSTIPNSAGPNSSADAPSASSSSPPTSTVPSDPASSSSAPPSTSDPPPSTTSSDPPTTTSQPPTTTSSSTTTPPPPPPPTTTTSTPTTTTPTPTSAPPPTSTTTTPSSTSPSSTPSTTETPSSSTSTITAAPTTTTDTVSSFTDSNGSTRTTTITSFASQPSSVSTGAGAGAGASASGTPSLNPGGSSSATALSQQKKIAVAVVVPVVGVALIVLAGLYFWRRHKRRMDAEEERRKEVEDYAYNPNNDPTLPNVGAAGTYEMNEDTSAGYRGWGSTTLAGSSGRKGSTTMSGGATGAAYSDGTPPVQGPISNRVSGEPLMSDRSQSPEGEILGVMGPSSADNRGGNVHRGPSNASSSYSAAGRSDGSGENVAYGGAGYYDQYGNNNPYSDPYSDASNSPIQPVIRDNPARRNTRIENPSQYHQQSAGISQNF
ncbi:hypothetical protein F4861DRAFT_30914 [Xylaria intraflava]|nr:hypothetical protein F4861DRAFT_30914 [Xylaria intraflava]